IKTSGGKYISPQAIEVMFKAVCPLASQMFVHADRRNYATALITLDPDALAQWARAQGLVEADYEADYAVLAADQNVHSYVNSTVGELNGRLNRWETIKDFRILDHDLSVESGELTPSLKVKRRTMEAKYGTLLDSMYGGQSRA
ncbi:MAG: long-chain fatty acid--CoA ligase, partial [Nocardioides sp.]